jgi:hypothetical protein
LGLRGYVGVAQKRGGGTVGKEMLSRTALDTILGQFETRDKIFLIFF